MNDVRFRIFWSCCCKRSRDQTYTALFCISRTLTPTEGWVAEARIGSVTSPNSPKPAIVSRADAGAAKGPPAAMVKLYETSFLSSLLESG